MNSEILYSEKQRFRQWWLWMILLGANCFSLFAVYKQVAGGQQFGDKPMSNAELLIAAGLIIVLTVFFINFHLDTIIKKDGIYVRFFPFHIKFKHYTWDSLRKSFVRRYSAITEYGGWGLRIRFSGNGSAFNVSGNQGLQLEFVNNKKLLIGTKKPEQLSEILNTIGQLKQ